MKVQSDLFDKALNDFISKNKIEDFNEPYIKDFEQKLSEFIGQKKLCEHVEIRELLLELISEYKYYSKKNVEEIFVGFYNQITETIKLDERYTIYTHIPSEKDLSRGNSSLFFLNKFFDVNYIESKRNIDITSLYLQGLNDKTKNPYCTPKSYRKITHIDNVICLDDFSGSGKTIKEFLKKSAELIKDKKVIIFLIHITDIAKNVINQAFARYGYTDFQLLYYHKSDNIFSSHSKYALKKELIRVFEQDQLASEFPLGFNGSSSLVTFFRNSPNNTLSSYWWQSEEWHPLFPRKEDVLDLFGKEKKQKFVVNVRYNLVQILPPQFMDIYDIKDILYMMYFKDYAELAETFELKELLGYNDEQLLEHKSSLISRQLIEEDNILNFEALSILNKLGLFKKKLTDLSGEHDFEIADDILEINAVYTP